MGRDDARNGERGRIVIADDHEPTRVLLRTLIELEGMQVVGEAQDGSEAVALVLAHEPDAVLLDINMPGLDGLDAAEIIRAWRPQVRLLLHSGEPLEPTLDRAAGLQLDVADKRDLHITIQQLPRQTETPPGAQDAERFLTNGSRQASDGSSRSLRVDGDRAGVVALAGRDGIRAMPDLLVDVNARVRELADPHVVGERRGFVCECGTPGCHEVVALSVSEYEVVRAGGAAILADGHTQTRGAAARARAQETRDASAALRGEGGHQASRAQRASEAANARIERVCARCGYGVAVGRTPERCPMCASGEWRPANGGSRPLPEP